ncbi:MAG TPA: quinoprotein relay system zinc metallohydrolase 2 [Woeseiaceae bacterium]|nr:quinoprotein relay system zinc metallohydrolase 2 [Woeseiaceae bacterium]
MTALHPRQPHWRAPLSILVWLVLQSMGAAASATDAAPSAELRQVADGVFVRPGQTGVLFEADNVANLGVVIGNRCVAVIDTGGSKSEGKALAAAIGKLTDVPVCFVINTHVHPDHLLGNEAFSTGQVRFIGHEKLPGAMAARGELYLRRAAEYSGGDAGVEMVAPEQTVRDEVQIDLGNRVLVVRAFATAHTDNDLTVLDEQTGTLFAGDLVFLEHLPVLDGSINGWLIEVGRLAARDFARVVPGHGPVEADWPEAAGPVIEYLEDLREATRAFIAMDGDLRSAQETITVSRPERWRLIEQYQKGNVAAAFAELEWED